MSSRRSSLHYRTTSTDEFSNGNASPDELPDDLETARTIIESLTRQLKIHDDVTSNLILLQKRIQHTHQRTQDAMQMLEDRLDNVEAAWTKELEDQHKRWLDRYNRLIKEVESTRAVNKTAPTASATGSTGATKIAKNQLESFNRRAKNVEEGLNELAKVATSTKNFNEKLRRDKQKIKDIDARLKTLAKKEQSLNAELTKQMNAHFRKPFAQVTEERPPKDVYGVCEVVDGYNKTIENLEKALQKLEQIRKVPSMRSIDSSIQNVPLVDEIDEIVIIMRRFVAKLRVQLASAHFSGSPAHSPLMHTGKSASPKGSSSSLKSPAAAAASSNAGSSTIGTSSDDDTAPLNTSQSVPTGPPTSVHPQFMALKSSIKSRDLNTAKENTDGTSVNTKK